MGRTTCAMAAGFEGMSIGATLGSVVPIVGTFVGGVVGYIAGSNVGSAIYSGAKKIASAAVEVVSTAWDAVCDIGSSIVSGIGDFIGSLFDW